MSETGYQGNSIPHLTVRDPAWSALTGRGSCPLEKGIKLLVRRQRAEGPGSRGLGGGLCCLKQQESSVKPRASGRWCHLPPPVTDELSGDRTHRGWGVISGVRKSLSCRARYDKSGQ